MQKLATAIMLAIGAAANMKPYQSGMLQSSNEFKYGRFITNMKASSVHGTQTAFALVNNDVFNHQSEWMSIDVNPSIVHGVVNTNMSIGLLDEGERYHPQLMFDFDDFHDFEIEWTPDYIAYSIDGVEIRRRESDHLSYDVPSNIVLSLQSLDRNSPNGRGFDATYLPTKSEVRYVEVWDYIPPSEEGTSFFFQKRFKDTFDNLGQWTKGEFDTRDELITSNFRKDQVHVSSGHLILNLEDPNSANDEHHKETEKNTGFKHDLPAPQEGSLDAAIEKATRAALVAVKDQLNKYSHNVAEYYLH